MLRARRPQGRWQARVRRAIGTGAAAVSLTLLLAGCASTPGTPAVLNYAMDDLPDGATMVWPAPPEPARYAFAGSLSGERNFAAAAGVPVSRWRAFGRWLVGLDDADKPEQLQRPAAVATDAAGRVYVSDVGRQAVLVFDTPAGQLQVWDRATGLLRLHSPGGLVPAPGGGVWVADAQLGAVFRLDARGEPRGEIGRGLLQRPTGLARDPASGLLYVADTQAHDIKVFDAAGRLRTTLGRRGEAPGQFNFPTHLAWARGELYVTDTFNHRVQILSGPALGGAAGAPLQARSIGARGLQLGDLVRPKGVAVDGTGRIVVVESYYDSLLVYAANGDFLLPIGAGAGSGGLVAAAAAAAPPAPSSSLTSFAAPAASATPLAPVAAARLYLPAGVWADDAGQLWVADQFKARIVRLRYVGPDAVPRPADPAAAPLTDTTPRPAAPARAAAGG